MTRPYDDPDAAISFHENTHKETSRSYSNFLQMQRPGHQKQESRIPEAMLISSSKTASTSSKPWSPDPASGLKHQSNCNIFNGSSAVCHLFVFLVRAQLLDDCTYPRDARHLSGPKPWTFSEAGSHEALSSRFVAGEAGDPGEILVSFSTVSPAIRERGRDPRPEPRGSRRASGVSSRRRAGPDRAGSEPSQGAPEAGAEGAIPGFDSRFEVLALGVMKISRPAAFFSQSQHSADYGSKVLVILWHQQQVRHL